MMLARVISILLVGASCAAGQVTHTICDVQQYDAGGLSPLVDQEVAVGGIVTVPPGVFQAYLTSFFIESGGCGVNVFCFDPLTSGVVLGDSVVVTGVVGEYISSSTGAGATTEIVLGTLADIDVIQTGNPEPEPEDLDIPSLAVEANEGRLLRTVGWVSRLELPYAMYIEDGRGELQVYRACADVSFHMYDEGDTLRVTGILMQYDRTAPFFDGYELSPRSQDDIEEWTMTPTPRSSWGEIKSLFR